MTFTRALSTNNYGPAKFIVDGSSTANGTHSTIQAAITSASSGDIIFIRPGTYTENLTLKSGVTFFNASMLYNPTSGIHPVVIVGKAIDNGVAVNTSFTGIELRTNSDFFLSLTAGSVVELNSCFLNCLNNTGISCTNTSIQLLINNCGGDIGTTGISLISSTNGTITLQYSRITNTGGASTASTIVGGIGILWSRIDFPISCSASSISNVYHSQIDSSATNTTSLTSLNSALITVAYSELTSGTASAMSIAGSARVQNSTLNSSNANVLTGAGTLAYGGIVFTGSSSGHNVSTENPYATLN